MPMHRTDHGLVIEPVALAQMPSAN